MFNRVPMNIGIFEEPLFNVNRRLLMVLGIWPYAKTSSKLIARSLILSVLIVTLIPHINAAILHYDNVDRMMLSILIVLTELVMILKMFAMIFGQNNIKTLYNSLANNWMTLPDEKEKEILVEYAERGRMLTIFYTVFMAVAASMINILPGIPVVLDRTYPLSTPRVRITVGRGEYFVDRRNYFIELYLVDAITVYAATMVTTCVESMYITCAMQSCALYAIVSHRIGLLRRMSSDIQSITINDEDCNSFKWISQTMQLHQTALDFTSTLDDAFSMCFLFIVSQNILALPLTVCAMIANLNDPMNLLTYLCYFLALVIHFFALIWPGQQILSHGESLCDQAYCNEWYATPLRTKKLLVTFMLRCSQPLAMSAGGLLLMNYETYSMITRTAASYITVLASFR